MATARARAESGLEPGVPGLVYGKRDNIKVPDADDADDTIDDATFGYNARAAAVETDRHKSSGTGATNFAPDTADYAAKGSERTTN